MPSRTSWFVVVGVSIGAGGCTVLSGANELSVRDCGDCLAEGRSPTHPRESDDGSAVDAVKGRATVADAAPPNADSGPDASGPDASGMKLPPAARLSCDGFVCAADEECCRPEDERGRCIAAGAACKGTRTR